MTKKVRGLLGFVLVLTICMIVLNVDAKSRPVITTQPKSVTTEAGITTKFTVKATGATSYQWQYRTSSSGTWKKATASGNQTAVLKVPGTISRNGYQYRCRVKNSAGTINSNVVTLTVKQTPVIVIQPKSIITEIGTTAKFTVQATGVVSYQWQYRTSSSGTWKKATASGNQTSILKVPGTISRNDYQYRCMVTSGTGMKKYTNAVTLKVYGIQTNPVDVSVVEGEIERVPFRVDAVGAISYQWQYRTSVTDSWKKATAKGNQTEELRVPATISRNGYQYRCAAKSINGETFYSDFAELTVEETVKFRITQHPQNVKSPIDEDVYFTVAVEGGTEPFTYEWQYICNGMTDYESSCTIVTTTRYDTLQVAVSETTFTHNCRFRCIVIDAEENQLVSESAYVEPI